VRRGIISDAIVMLQSRAPQHLRESGESEHHFLEGASKPVMLSLKPLGCLQALSRAVNGEFIPLMFIVK
jgi:hypothetical protein